MKLGFPIQMSLNKGYVHSFYQSNTYSKEYMRFPTFISYYNLDNLRHYLYWKEDYWWVQFSEKGFKQRNIYSFQRNQELDF